MKYNKNEHKRKPYLKKLFPAIIIVILSVFLFTAFHSQRKSIVFSSHAQQAIEELAKNMLINGSDSHLTDIHSQLDPQDYKTIKDVSMHPDNPLYFFESFAEELRLFFIFDEGGKIKERLEEGNELSLEALLLIEKASQEKDVVRRERLLSIVIRILDDVGSNFDYVSQTIDLLEKDNPEQARLVKADAFQFAEYYLKHQILLQKAEDQLEEHDYLIVEAARIKHLPSIAHIIVSNNEDPVIFANQLSQSLASQVGSANSLFAAIVILRDLENNAQIADVKKLQIAQIILQAELVVKLTKLSIDERIKLVEQYKDLIHANPVREFQAYDGLAKMSSLREIDALVSSLKEKEVQDFIEHLLLLDTQALQQLHVNTLFTDDITEIRLPLYIETQLENSKTSSKTNLQLQRLQNIKSLLAEKICRVYGKNPNELTKTRFYTEATTNPTNLDIQVIAFALQSIKDCDNKASDAVTVVSSVQDAINNTYIAVEKTEAITIRPANTQSQALAQLKNIITIVESEQSSMEQIKTETKQTPENPPTSIPTNNPATPTVYPTNTLVPTGTLYPTLSSTLTPTSFHTPIPTFTSASKNTTNLGKSIADEIVNEVLADTPPAKKEVAEKVEQIIDEIQESAQNGQVDEIVSELPEDVQEEIIEEIGILFPTVVPQSEPTIDSQDNSTVQPTESSPGNSENALGKNKESQ